MLGGRAGERHTFAGCLRRCPPKCDRLLGQFHLHDVMDQQVALLPYGKRRLLEIAMAIACRPRVLLLDEPVAGVPEDYR